MPIRGWGSVVLLVTLPGAAAQSFDSQVRDPLSPWGTPGPGLLRLSTQDGPASTWTFEPGRLHGDTFKAGAGPLDARSSGPVRFAAEAPKGLLLGETAEAGAPKNQAGKGGGFLSIATEIPGPALPTREMTVEAWVRVDKPQEWGGLVGLLQDNGDFERGWLLGYNQKSFFFALAGETRKRLTYLVSKRTYQAGAWYHVAATYDGAELRLYVDSSPAASDKSQTGAIAYPERGFYTLGAYRDDNETYPMSGQLEQVSVWKKVLTAEEIRRRFDDRKGRFPGIEAVRPVVTDWPTHLRDNQRSALSDAEPPLPLKLDWVYSARHAPQPAWPPEAKQDFFNNKPALPERTTFDHAFHLAAVGDLVCFGSSADDQVRALDLATGRERWTFFAEGPVRLAPTFAEGRVLFGSDDGFVYCLDAKDGSLHWKLQAGKGRRIPGNQRVISTMPVRTGVLVDEGQVHYCAGIFAVEGVVHGTADLKTGRALGEVPLDSSPQGYLEQKSGRLFVSTGRASAGAIVGQLKRRGKNVDPEASPAAYPHAFVGAGRLRFGGGDGKVAAFSVEDGREAWSAAVEGKAHALAVVRDRLLVSTDRGRIYCFAPGDAKGAEVAPPAPADFPQAGDAARTAAAAILASASPQGYALVLGAGEGGLAYELAKQSSLRVVAVESDPAKVVRARQALAAAGLYGRVSVHALRPDGPLPYTDWMFNLVVADGSSGKLEEVLRVLRPGGLAFPGGPHKPSLRGAAVEGAGEWSHLYGDPANTACSGDRRVGKDLDLQWFGLPGPGRMIDRHHRTGPPLAKGGLLFVPGNDRVFGLDAYNGTVLWELEVPGSRRMAIFRDCGNMAAAEEAFYVAAAGKCLKIGPATGKVTETLDVQAAADGKPRDWGYLAVPGDLLLASSVLPGASQRELSRRMVTTETYWDFKPAVCSDGLWATDRKDGSRKWSYRPKGAILNPTITVGGGRAYFVESADERTLAKGRSPLVDLLGKGCRVTALDLKTGEPVWSRPHDLSAVQHALYAIYSEERLVLVGSRNAGTGKASTVWYDVRGLDAATGKEAWFKSQNYGAGVNGEHGEQDHHPLAMGGRLYVEPRVYDVKTGKDVDDYGWKPRRGCGTISASASTLYFRDKNACLFDPATRQKKLVTADTRPGCWINMIPAGGLLLIPEASSGCSCDFAVQASLAFLPAKTGR